MPFAVFPCPAATEPLPSYQLAAEILTRGPASRVVTTVFVEDRRQDGRVQLLITEVVINRDDRAAAGRWNNVLSRTLGNGRFDDQPEPWALLQRMHDFLIVSRLRPRCSVSALAMLTDSENHAIAVARAGEIPKPFHNATRTVWQCLDQPAGSRLGMPGTAPMWGAVGEELFPVSSHLLLRDTVVLSFGSSLAAGARAHPGDAGAWRESPLRQALDRLPVGASAAEHSYCATQVLGRSPGFTDDTAIMAWRRGTNPNI